MRLARNAMWTTIGVGGQQVIRLVVMILLARILTPREFGIVAAAQIILALAETFKDFGIGSGLVQAKTLDHRLERSAMTFVLLSSVLIAAVIALSSGLFAAALGIPEVAALLPWFALTFLLYASSAPMVQLLFRNDRYRDAAVMQLVSYGLGYSVTAVALAIAGWSYWALVAGVVGQSVLQLLMLLWMRPVLPTLRPDWPRLRPLLNFGLGVLATNTINSVAAKADNFVVGRALGAASLGFYSRAYSLMELANSIPGVIFGRVLLPSFSRMAHGEGKPDDASRHFYISHVAAAAMTLPATVATLLLAPEIVYIVLGGQWGPVAPVLTILGSGMYLRRGYRVSTTVVLAYGQSWRTVLPHCIYAAIVLAGSVIGIVYGLPGVAAGVLVALAWQYWALTARAVRATQANWRELGLALLPVVWASAGALLCGLGARAALAPETGAWARVLIVGAFAAATYAGALWLFRSNPYVVSLLNLTGHLFAMPGRYRVPD